MNRGVWIGSRILDSGRVLILGESHYGNANGDRIKYDDVDYGTAEVVEEYLDGTSHKHWFRFFYRIAESFGYTDKSSIMSTL